MDIFGVFNRMEEKEILGCDIVRKDIFVNFMVGGEYGKGRFGVGIIL